MGDFHVLAGGRERWPIVFSSSIWGGTSWGVLIARGVSDGPRSRAPPCSRGVDARENGRRPLRHVPWDLGRLRSVTSHGRGRLCGPDFSSRRRPWARRGLPFARARDRRGAGPFFLRWVYFFGGDDRRPMPLARRSKRIATFPSAGGSLAIPGSSPRLGAEHASIGYRGKPGGHLATRGPADQPGLTP